MQVLTEVKQIKLEQDNGDRNSLNRGKNDNELWDTDTGIPGNIDKLATSFMMYYKSN
jgi:hypothetical protein